MTETKATPAMKDPAPCTNPLCDRPTRSAFCCEQCKAAFDGHYEIHESGPLAHPEWCNMSNRILTGKVDWTRKP